MARWERGGDGGDDGGDGDGHQKDDDDVDDDVAVARWERGLQGFDDDPNWWLHPLLPYAHRSQCGQVHLPQIYDTSLLKNIIINWNDHCLVIMLQVHQHQ